MRRSDNTLIFRDYPEFRPNRTPAQMFQAGIFGGTYFRPIYSQVTKRNHRNNHLKFPKSWFTGIDVTLDSPDKKLNKYGVLSGTSLKYWESRGWITRHDPYGWVQWYCNFYKGRRTPDDERQIKRWMGVAGTSGRFRTRLINMCKAAKVRRNNASISPTIRQLLLQWGVEF